jgi:hypothetical protein
MGLTQVKKDGITWPVSNAIVNADVNTSAAIAGSKIANLVSNDADDRLLTATGTANSFNGEANLTYDGNNLQQSIDSAGEGIRIKATGDHWTGFYGNANRSSADTILASLIGQWNGTTVGGVHILSGSDTTNKDDGRIAFLTSVSDGNDPVERMRITDDGKIGIGTTSPSEKLHVGGDVLIDGAAGGTLVLGGSAAHTSKVVIGDNAGSGNGNLLIEGGDGTDFLTINSAGKVGIGTSSPGLKLHIQDGALASAPTPNSNCDVVIEGTTNTGIQFLSSGQTQLRFGDAGSTAAGAIIYEHSGDLLKLNYSNSGAITFNDGSGEVGRFTPDGLTFNGDTATANALNDYEEGTITWSCNNNNDVTFESGYVGRYTKIGELVTVSGYLVVDDWTSSSTDIQISLPFTSAANSEGYYSRGVGATFSGYLDLPANYENMVAYVGGGENYMRFFTTRTTGGNSPWHGMRASDFTTNTKIYFNVCYTTTA